MQLLHCLTGKFPALWKRPEIMVSKELLMLCLSRGVAGFIKNTLVITLPGSPKGVAETIDAIFPYVLHVFRVKEGVKHEG